ncbi:hypothetical protein [Clostridium sp. C2-6-12]|uniref:hypothetical protein n=1 Tax=Clostridium sp. C2-6-12 TaxID=2698832 RepID=UPI00136BB98F|nr:hypothetical protein [Clostridium sp. C2-6-12]
MKKRILSSILTLFLFMGIQIPVQAKVLIKDGIPQEASVTIDTYRADGWGAYPDYHVQNANPSIWVSQFNTGKNSLNNCLPACTKMLANTKNVLSDKSVEAISNDGVYLGTVSTMMEYLKPYEFNSQFIYGDGKDIKRYLDWGNIIAIPTLVHARLCIGYATRGDKVWFEVLDPANNSIDTGHQWIPQDEIGIGFAITNTNAATKWDFSYKLSDGTIKSATGFYNSLYYYVPKKVVDELLPQDKSQESIYANIILPGMNKETTKENTITNITNVDGTIYSKIGNDVYVAYDFYSDEKLQNEGNIVSVKGVYNTTKAA